MFQSSVSWLSRCHWWLIALCVIEGVFGDCSARQELVLVWTMFTKLLSWLSCLHLRLSFPESSLVLVRLSTTQTFQITSWASLTSSCWALWALPFTLEVSGRAEPPNILCDHTGVCLVLPYLDLTSSVNLCLPLLFITAQDCLAPVAGDNMGLQDNFKDLKTFQNGLKVSFACNDTYKSVGGSPNIICTNGSWSPLRLKCESEY